MYCQIKRLLALSAFIYLSRVSARKGMRPYAITLPCNTVKIIFVAGLKEDKNLSGYIEILSASIVLLNKYVKFELGLKKQIGTIKLDILNLIPQALKLDLDLNHVKG